MFLKRSEMSFNEQLNKAQNTNDFGKWSFRLILRFIVLLLFTITR